ncbi:hypothetical protein PCYB_103210 [Plasmodium cynomolgi strain B]|uniref:ERCC4 domain-containing protein n=1 Tax=Plasmodium cynomolgi (strain B) TaxID=1120755 RepID=K6UDP7_PLACD|nr:hypothetical protein PCYB_103210 [Plasmodium cynomolgi strain B]GAB66971.1 hypothetical protein PCYB_103210 [Plasmodium cynomolgi strain B]
MENIRIVLSEDLRGGKVHAELQALLKEEEEKDKNETEYGKMLQGGDVQGGHSEEGNFEEGHFEEGHFQGGPSQRDDEGRTPLLEKRTCHIYTNFPYKSHFVKNHERKNKEDGPERYTDDMELSGYNEVEEEETPPASDLQLALILVLIDEPYIEEECPHLRTSILSKIEKIQKAYDHVKVICLFIGVREYINRTNCNKDVGESFDKRSITERGTNRWDAEHTKINEKLFDRLIATLLIRHQVDSIEMENDKNLHRFIFKCCRYLYLSKVRKLNSYFKVKPPGLSQLNRERVIREKGIPPPPGTLAGTLAATPPQRRHFPTWVSQLMQINGLSEDASISIAQAFGTPFDLIMHLKKKDDEECLQDYIISSSYGDRRLGRALSRKVFRVFSPDAHPENYVS